MPFHYSLRAYNTFGFDVHARDLQVIKNEAQLINAIQAPREISSHQGLKKVLVLGGGSNVVLTRDFDGVVWLMRCRGRRLISEDRQAWFVEAHAGENWHDFVRWTLQQNWPGLENLALIPGTVGAAPLQNIGAYGLEISERLAQVRAFDGTTGKPTIFDAAACGLSYRDSFFKRTGSGRFVITSLILRLPKAWQARCSYPSLATELRRRKIAQPSPHDIFDAVSAIRRAKLPDPAKVGNVGSFFKNPIIEAKDFMSLAAHEPTIAAYPQANGQIKLAAAWLIERCGWKGRVWGAAAVDERQALVLINRGGSNGAKILALAGAIQRDVYARFGVWLEPEPVIV